MSAVVWTIGHSTRSIEVVAALTHAHGVNTIADVRTVPRSRHNPQWNRETLPEALGRLGLRYVHLPGLGGLRRPQPDSPNTAWVNAGFRGYADYMQTTEFTRSLESLIQLARERVAVMCAEAVPWRCHRSLIADALTVRGLRVEHIMTAARSDTHRLSASAHVEGTRITYPPRTPPLPGVLGEPRGGRSGRRGSGTPRDGRLSTDDRRQDGRA